MPELAQITTVFQNFSGAPGYNNLYFFGDPISPSTLTSASTAAFTFWNNVVVQMSQGISFAIQPDVSILDPATGALIRSMSHTPSSQSNFASAGAYAGGAGAVVGWKTAAVHRTRRLRGRTFVVPLGGGSYQSDGTLASATLTALQTHSANLQAVANFGVWGRPVAGAGGVWSAATAYAVRDRVAVLRSRR